jgi:ethanolamine utilization cobalamin adenosyltransferase
MLLSLRWLFATPYHSSKATIDDSRMTLLRATARWNRRRTLTSEPLINAMHAFVSIKYFVIRTRLAQASEAAFDLPA